MNLCGYIVSCLGSAKMDLFFDKFLKKCKMKFLDIACLMIRLLGRKDILMQYKTYLINYFDLIT